MKDQFQKRQSLSLPSGLLRNLTLMTTGGIALVAVLLGIGMWQTGSRFFERLDALFNAPPPQPEVDVRSLIVSQVRGASELTTAVFTMEAVVPTRQARNIGGYTVGTTTLLYIAYGEVRAGVDLGELTAANVQVNNNTVQIQLPPANPR